MGCPGAGEIQRRDSWFREESNPFMTLHREMSPLFNDVLRGLDMPAFGG